MTMDERRSSGPEEGHPWILLLVPEGVDLLLTDELNRCKWRSDTAEFIQTGAVAVNHLLLSNLFWSTSEVQTQERTRLILI